MSNIDTRTPLMLACRANDLGEVLRLIELGADVNAQNDKGTTPLMYAKTAAFGSGDFRILEALINAGADLDAVDNAGKTALDYSKERSAALIEFLLTIGGKPLAHRALNKR